MRTEFKLEWEDRDGDKWRNRWFIFDGHSLVKAIWDELLRGQAAGLISNLRVSVRVAFPWEPLDTMPAVWE